jgi:hypothetical protein
MKINFRTVVVVFASFFLFAGINHGLVGFHNASASEVTINNGHEIFPDGHEQFPDDHEISPDGHEQFPDGEVINVG